MNDQTNERTNRKQKCLLIEWFTVRRSVVECQPFYAIDEYHRLQWNQKRESFSTATTYYFSHFILKTWERSETRKWIKIGSKAVIFRQKLFSHLLDFSSSAHFMFNSTWQFHMRIFALFSPNKNWKWSYWNVYGKWSAIKIRLRNVKIEKWCNRYTTQAQRLLAVSEFYHIKCLQECHQRIATTNRQKCFRL